MLAGGHRFIFTAEGNRTRIDHELEMTPRGIFKVFAPFMGVIGRKNLLGTAKALQEYLESKGNWLSVRARLSRGSLTVFFVPT